MHYRIDDLESFSEAVRDRLIRAGVKSTRQLLDAGATAEGRAGLARRAGISEPHVLHGAHLADLLRVKGVGDGYVALLDAAGVSSLAALKACRPRALHARLAEAKPGVRLVKRLPTVDEVAGWLDHAAALQPIVT